jgi:hypothetical protein
LGFVIALLLPLLALDKNIFLDSVIFFGGKRPVIGSETVGVRKDYRFNWPEVQVVGKESGLGWVGGAVDGRAAEGDK